MQLTRRDMLVAAIGAGAVGAAGGVVWRATEPRFDFAPIAEVPGFRRVVTGGGLSRAGAAFVGIDGGPTNNALTRRTAEVAAAPCPALFDPRPGALPIASFSDFYCPNCVEQTARLQALAEEPGSNISVRWHELPIFGPASEAAARAAIAASFQDAYPQMHARLMRTTFLANPSYLRAVSDEIGLDGEQLIADSQSDAATRSLLTAQALAQVFGIPGTPALVVGRTLVVGEIGPRALDRLIELERNTAALCT